MAPNMENVPAPRSTSLRLRDRTKLHGNAYEFIRNSALDARNFFDFGSIPNFQRNEFGGSLGGPVKKDKTFFFANYEGYRQVLGLSDVTLVPDATSRAAAVPSIQPLLGLWPVANGPELLTSTGGNSGIAKAFSNPPQHIREDFGTARIDQTISDKDSFAVVYTVDDSGAHSPTTNPFSVTNVFLREQVASASETHIFSPNFINKATVGFSRGGFYFDSGVDGTAAAVPGGWIHAGQPVGAVVVGGGTTLNGASQFTNGGTNAGSNLSAVRNLFTITDQVSITHGKHLITAGRLVPAAAIQQQSDPGPVRASVVLQPGRLPGRHGEYLDLRSVRDATLLAIARRRIFRRGCHQAAAEPGTSSGFPG